MYDYALCRSEMLSLIQLGRGDDLAWGNVATLS